MQRRRWRFWPRAIFLALAVTTTLDIAIQLVAQGVLGPLLAQHTSTPLADAAARFLGSGGMALMPMGPVGGHHQSSR